MKRFPLVPALAFASFAFASAAPVPPKKADKAKEANEGKPAFAPDLTQKPFDPAAVTEDHLVPGSFKVPEGLEVTLWATSPMLYNPANMDVDAKGRVWISEGVNYRSKSGRRPAGDRIMVLEDTDGDGKADKSHVFVQDPELTCPLGVAVFDNVVVVSNTPDLIVYTDVDRDGVFNPKVDKREVLLTGFMQKQHDHSLHVVFGGPDGRWYFSNGNCGAQFTDKTGHQFNVGGAYLHNPWAGQPSYDGHVYVGGFVASVDPNGGNAKILAYGFRNSYEQMKTSLGDLFQSDNDDPPACRVTPLIEGGNMGFFSPDGQRSWQADKRPGQSVPTAEWRQEDPDTIPAGDVYGGGAPTGMAFYENGALGDKWKGLLLSCETGRNVVFGYQPKPEGAGWKMERFDFITSNTTGKFQGSDFVFVASGSKDISDERHIQFRPSDVTVGPDGAIYVCDWFDKRTGGHATLDDSCSGSVYRIAPKGFKSKVPAIDYNTTAGQIEALQSPAVNTRFVGFSKLKAQGAKVIPDLLALKSDNEYVAARKVWLLAQLGEAGIKVVTEMLKEENPTTRLVAFRALKAAGVDPMTYAATLAKDTSAVVRRDLAASLRDAAADQAVPALVELAKGFDGSDRSYLAAWGIGCMGKEAAVWTELSKSMEWNDKLAWLAWRLHPKDAIASVKARALDVKLTPMLRKQAVDTLAFTRDVEAAKALIEVAKDKASPVLGDAMWWLINRSTNDWSSYGVPEMLKNAGILDPAQIKLTAVVSPEPPSADKIPAVADVLKLKGDAKNGATVVQRCFMCHQINGQGVDFGPGLTGWGATQPTDVITEAVLNPSKDIAHGFEGSSIVTKDGTRIDGIILTDGEFVMIKSMAGLTQIVPKELIKSKKKLDRSLMLGAVQLGLTPQEVADVVAYLRTGK